MMVQTEPETYVHTSPVASISMSQQEFDLCLKILNEIKKHRASWIFAKPVTEDIAPGYFTIIKTPMDLTTITDKMPSYKSKAEFVSDMRLMFSNCTLYNGPQNPFSEASEILRSYFERRLVVEVPELPLIESLKRKIPTPVLKPANPQYFQVQPPISHKKKIKNGVFTSSPNNSFDSVNHNAQHQHQQRPSPSSSTKYTSNTKTHRSDGKKASERKLMQTQIIPFKKSSEFKTSQIVSSTHKGFIIHRMKVSDAVIMKRDCDSLWDVNGIIQLAASLNDVELDENIESYVLFGEDEFHGVW
jgi:hypothetical protein